MVSEEYVSGTDGDYFRYIPNGNGMHILFTPHNVYCLPPQAKLSDQDLCIQSELDPDIFHCIRWLWDVWDC